MSTPATTVFPFRYALGNAIRDIVVDTVVPAFNAGLQTYLSGASNIPVFADADVIYGNKLEVKTPVICVYVQHDTNSHIAMQTDMSQWYVNVCLKVPFVAANEPEAYNTVGDCFLDNTRAAFVSPNVYNLTPKNANGNLVLPGVNAYTNTYFCEGLGPLPKRDSANQLTYWEWMAVIKSQISLAFDRGTTF